MDEKLIRDALGSPVPQHYNEELDMFTVNTLDGSTVTNGDIDFSQTKLLRDRLGSVIPQVWDAQNYKWVVVTTQSTGGNSGGDIGPITWDNIQGKPSQFTPSTHTHEISEINGLQDRLDEVFQQVSSGKSLLETAVVAKGSIVNKVGDVATFEELHTAILTIEAGETNTDLLYGATNFSKLDSYIDGDYSIGIKFRTNVKMTIHGVTLIVPYTGGTRVALATGDGVEQVFKSAKVTTIGDQFDIMFDSPITLSSGLEAIVYFNSTNTGYYDLTGVSYEVNPNITILNPTYHTHVSSVATLIDKYYRPVFPIFSID